MPSSVCRRLPAVILPSRAHAISCPVATQRFGFPIPTWVPGSLGLLGQQYRGYQGGSAAPFQPSSGGSRLIP